MSDFNPKVMALVEAELAKNPDIPGDELFNKARKVSRAIGKLSRRQFHAKYPLQVKRRAKKSGAPKSARPRRASAPKAKAPRVARRRAAAPAAAPVAATGGAGNREALRAIFMRFATDLAAAEERKDVVRVLANVDAYVDRALAI